MRLKFEPFDGRGRNHRDIVDEDTGTVVGYIHSFGVGTYCSGGIEVSLFNNKYAILVSRYEECWGFIKGVETVLRHMTFIEPAAASSKAA